MSTTTLFVLAIIGGILPDLIRILKESRAGKPFELNITSVIIQIILGVLAVWVLMIIPLEDNQAISQDAVKALGLGYAAPDLLTRAIASTIKPPQVPQSQNDENEEDQDEMARGDRIVAEPVKPSRGLMDWWRV